MSTRTRIQKPFSSYRLNYGITNPHGKDLARIEFFRGRTKVGQALFGDAISPGSFASLINEAEIHLFFPLSHFSNLLNLLLTQKRLSLFVDVEDAATEGGGIMTRPPA